MRKILRRLPSPAMVVACIALAVALGGSRYAAIKLPRNCAGRRHPQTNPIAASQSNARSIRSERMSPLAQS